MGIESDLPGVRIISVNGEDPRAPPQVYMVIPAEVETGHEKREAVSGSSAHTVEFGRDDCMCEVIELAAHHNHL